VLAAPEDLCVIFGGIEVTISYPIECITVDRLKSICDHPKSNGSLGRYLCLNDDLRFTRDSMCITACDNRDGQAWLENFDNVQIAIKWLDN